MTTLTICRGVSGSGKSTWARQQNATVVSRDDIRVMLYPQIPVTEYYTVDKEILHRREDTVTTVQDSMIAALLKAGKDVIVDNTNIQFTFVKALAKIGYRYGANVEVKVFDVPYTEALNRNRARAAAGGRNVDSEVIAKQHRSFKSNKNMTLDPVVTPKHYNRIPGTPIAFMVDIDGTLADHTGKRSPYALNVEVDDVREHVADTVTYIKFGMEKCHRDHQALIVMSGRKEDCREATEKWLEDFGIPFDYLFMRASDDNRADNLVKADLFDAHVRDKFDVIAVFDDRQQVVDMWRSIGLDCYQVQPGDF